MDPMLQTEGQIIISGSAIYRIKIVFRGWRMRGGVNI